MKERHACRLSSVPTLGFASLVLTFQASAQDVVYKSGLTPPTEATLGSNWIGEAAPGASNIAKWITDTDPVTAGNQESTGGAISVSSPVSWSGMRFEDSAGGITLSGSDINLGGGGILIGWETVRINNIITSASPLTVSRGFGTGVLQLGAANGFGGDTTLNAGASVQVFNTGALGTGSVIVAGNNATFQLGTGAGNFDRPISVGSGLNLNVGGGFLNLNSVISGDGRVTGTGSIHLRGINTYTGNTTFASGFLTIDKESSLGATPASPVANSLNFTGGGYLSNYIAGAAIILNANRGVTFNAGTTGGFDIVGQPLTVNGVITGDGTIRKQGGGNLILNGANTFTGGINHAAGTITVGNSAALGSGTVNVVGTGAPVLNVNATITNNIVISATAGLGFGGGFSPVDGVISGAGRIQTANSGVLRGDNTYEGGTNITGGFFCISKDSSLGLLPASPVANNINLSGGGSLSNFPTSFGPTVTVHANRGITLAAGMTGGIDAINGSTFVINGVISGDGGLRTSSTSTTGTIVLNGLNTYTGKTVLGRNTTVVSSIKNAGDFTGSSLGNPADAATGTIDLGSGTVANTTLRYVGTGSTTDRVINLAATTGGATLDQSGTGLLKFTGDFTATGAGSKTLGLTGSTTGIGEIAGAIVDNSVTNVTSVAKTGTGTWLLTGANTYTGTTTVNGGTLGGSGCTTSALSVNATGILAPGSGVGTFLASSAIFTDATYAVEVDRSSTTADSLLVPGVVDLLNTNLVVSEIGSGTVPLGTKFTIVDYTGGSLIGEFNGLTEGATIAAGSTVYTLHYADASKITLTATSAAPAGYDSWATQITNGETLRSEDADDDGFTNLDEFLFGTDPMTGNGSLTTTERSGNTLVIRWMERTSGATYSLKESATLTNPWTVSSAPTSNDGAAAGDYQPRRADVTIGSGKLFFRVEGVENN